MPTHFLELQDGGTVETVDLRLTRRVIANLADSSAMGAIYGEAGLGKTFAVSTFAAAPDA